MATLLIVAGMPAGCRRLIERLHSAECQIHLMPIVADHFSKIVHIGVIVLRGKVVFTTIRIATAARTYQSLLLGAYLKGQKLADVCFP